MIDSLIEKGYTPHMLAQDAVGKAMLYAHASLMKTVINDPILVTSGVEEILVEKSKGKCKIASSFAIDYIASNFMDEPNRLFTHACLITSYNDPNHPFVERYLTDKHNSYALLLDVEGYWHAFSPANYDPADSQTAMLVPYTSKDLKGILKNIADSDGGYVPDERYVIGRLFSKRYKQPHRDTKYFSDGEPDIRLCVGEVFTRDGKRRFNPAYKVPLSTVEQHSERIARVSLELIEMTELYRRHLRMLAELPDKPTES